MLAWFVAPKKVCTMAKPRLLVLASTFPATENDGTPGFVRDLAIAEAERFDTLVLVPAVPGAPREEWIGEVHVIRYRYFFRRWEDLADGAIIENLRSKKSRLLQVIPLFFAQFLAIQRHSKLHTPAVLHVHWIIPQGVCAWQLMKTVPAVVTSLGGDLYALQDPISTRVKRAVLSRAAMVTTVNADMREKVLALGVAPDDALVIPMGADVQAVRDGGQGIAPVPGRLIFVGRLVEKKGLTHLLDALHLLKSAHPWSLAVVGDGPLKDSLEGRAAGLPVEFLGQLGRDQLVKEYAKSQIAVVPSVLAVSGDQDGLPVALLEAMSAGKAVVASDLPGINEVISDEQSGLLVPPGDPVALAAGISRLLGEDSLRRTFGEAASQVADGLSMSAVGQRYQDLLQSLLRSGSGSG